MAQPFNYTFQQTDPFGSTMKGVETALGMASFVSKQRAAEAEASLKQAELQRAQEMQTELGSLARNPNATATDFTKMMIKYPALSKDLEKSWSVLSGDQKNNEITYGSQVLFALEGGQPDMAKNLVNERITALRNSGRDDDAKKQEVLLGLIDTNPDVARTSTNLSLVAAMGPDKYQELRTKIEGEKRSAAEEGRKAEKAPVELKDAIAKADKAEADAITAQAVAKNAAEREKALLDLEKARAEKAQIEAKYADQLAVADIKKKAADLGLTKAQTNEVLVRTNKLGIETKKAALELEVFKQTGGVDSEKIFAQEEKIRKEWQGRSKVYSELQGTFKNIQTSATSGTGAGDIALITAFMKMLDPGSVVRETEFATARDTAGLFIQLQNKLEKAKNGQFLDPKQRQDYVNLSKQYLASAQKKAEQEKKDLSLVVKNYKLNPENVFGAESTAPPPAGAGRGNVNPPAAGQRNITVDY